MQLLLAHGGEPGDKANVVSHIVHVSIIVQLA